MKAKYFSLFFSFIFFFSLSTFAQQINSLTGAWGGILDAGSQQLKFIFHIHADSARVLTATADSPDQHAFNLPVQSVNLQGDSIIFTMPAIHAQYAGKIDWDKLTITGNWTQRNYSFPLSLQKMKSDSSQPALNRPQEPKPPFPYVSKNITYNSPDKQITYGATLTYPDARGNFPAVVLITGSGQENRDEEIFGHKPFLVLADYLTRRGIAVLRVDDRGIGETSDPKKNFADNTSADFARDAINGVNYLKTLPQINSKNIGLIGHSEGATIASMVAAKDTDIAFIVMWAGAAVGGKKINLEQNIHALQNANISPQVIDSFIPLHKKLVNIAVNATDSASFKNEAADAFQKWASRQDETTLQQLHLQDTAAALKLIIRQYSVFRVPWMKFFIAYNPLQDIKKVSCPVLAINGDKDTQVKAKENLEAIKNALEEGGNKNFKIVEMPGLNHLLQTANTGEVSEYGEIAETISPKALQIIGDWIIEQTKR